MVNRAKYRKVTEWINKRISSGELKAGSRLESENEISRIFGISRQTVRHALAVLEQEDILVKIKGSGTYVGPRPDQDADHAAVSRTVTIISTYIDGYIFPRILKEMVKTLGESGYSVKLMYTENHLETERRLLGRLLEENSHDALIVEPVMSGIPNPNLDCYRKLQERGIPILFFHSNYPELNIPCVSMDDVDAGRKATEYLLLQGHTEIAGIFKADDGQGRRRFRGMAEALHQAGLMLDESRICWIDTQDIRTPAQFGDRVLKRLENCTACVCYNDEVAHLLTETCLERGIRIPEDLSVTSIDNSDLAKLNAVPLTSVVHPMERLGRKAAENMLKLIQDREYDASCFFPCGIEERASVRKINR